MAMLVLPDVFERTWSIRADLSRGARNASLHVVRGPEEPIDQRLEEFYNRLLTVLRQPVVRDGQWQLLECVPAWEGNWTWDCFLAFAWQGTDGDRLLVKEGAPIVTIPAQ